MAEQRTFANLCAQAGWCCRFGCLAVEELKVARTPDKRLKPRWFKAKFDLEYATARDILKKWREGKIDCENKEKCVLVLSGIKKEEIPSLQPETLRFLGLRGSTYPHAYWGRLVDDEGQVILKRMNHGPLQATIVHTSLIDWLWVVVVLSPEDRDIKLGDLLYLNGELNGTVLEIDGPNIVLLLPGNLHDQRNRDTAATRIRP